MKIEINKNVKIHNKKVSFNIANTFMLGIYEDCEINSLSENLKGTIQYLKERGKFKGSFGEVYNFSNKLSKNFKDIIILGLGKEKEFNSERARIVVGKGIRKAKELKANFIDLLFFESKYVCPQKIVKAIVEGSYLADYKFNKYKKDKKTSTIDEVNIIISSGEKLEDIKKAVVEATVLAEGTAFGRDLINEPANILGPMELAERAKQLGEECGFEVEIFNEEKIKELGMTSFLEVAKGSNISPRFIVMRYFGDPINKNNTIGFVGKGLTYDSGGYSIKPTTSMVNMKSDMGGSAAVIGAMMAITKMRLKANVVAVVAACENMISGKAYRPGDIIQSMAGKTIEVLNTDAEGRLTLVDAVYYAIKKEKVSKVIDIATLTGAVLTALGTTTTGVITNDEQFYKELVEASKLSDERIWQLPNYGEYKELIKSEIADLKNIGGKNAGTITAGLFIGEFVEDKPWLHMDIAGTSWSENEHDYISKGGTGVGVRTLYYLIKNMSN